MLLCFLSDQIILFLILCYYVVFALEGKVEFIHILLSTVGVFKLG